MLFEHTLRILDQQDRQPGDGAQGYGRETQQTVVQYLAEALLKIRRPFAEVFKEEVPQPHQPGDVILLTGVGEVFPLLRVHNLLNDMLADFGTVPVVVMYPGSFDGRQLKLFNKENASNYYRAFDIS